MSIKIKTPAPASPHGAQASMLAAMETQETATAETPAGPNVITATYMEHIPVPVQHERVAVSMAFKMPVAPYTMIEFRVSRDKPCAPGDVDVTFEELKAWVDDRVNELVQEQQEALPENATTIPQE